MVEEHVDIDLGRIQKALETERRKEKEEREREEKEYEDERRKQNEEFFKEFNQLKKDRDELKKELADIKRKSTERAKPGRAKKEKVKGLREAKRIHDQYISEQEEYEVEQEELDYYDQLYATPKKRGKPKPKGKTQRQVAMEANRAALKIFRDTTKQEKSFMQMERIEVASDKAEERKQTKILADTGKAERQVAMEANREAFKILGDMSKQEKKYTKLEKIVAAANKSDRIGLAKAERQIQRDIKADEREKAREEREQVRIEKDIQKDKKRYESEAKNFVSDVARSEGGFASDMLGIVFRDIRKGAIGRGTLARLRQARHIRTAGKPTSSAGELIRRTGALSAFKGRNRMAARAFSTATGLAAVTSNIGTYGGAFTAISMFTKRLPYIGLIIAAVAAITKAYLAQYRPGGVRDVRKLYRAQDESMIGITNENMIAAGETLFISNPHSLQGMPRGNSNTMNLRDGISRYNLRHMGDYPW